MNTSGNNCVIFMSMHLDRISDGIFRHQDRIFTRSLNPGKRVYGERLEIVDGQEYREWSQRRSKLAAFIRLGGDPSMIGHDSQVLYLGAASGTTASHISDIVVDGTVYCVEFSPRSFRDLVGTCEGRKNMHPLLGDATRPDDYQFMVGRVDLVYQDVAQKNQVDILLRNMERFQSHQGMMALKARSEDVGRNPHSIYKEAAKKAEDCGYQVLDLRPLDPFEKDHAMLVIKC